MKDDDVKKTPSALKWLAEKKARVAYDLQQAEALLVDIQSQVQTLRLDLAALDRALTIYDPAIDPSAIQPVHGWAGTYGKRGALRNCILDILAEHEPHWVSTDTVELLVRSRLKLMFDFPGERKRWYDNSLRDALKKLVAQGKVERRHDPEAFTAEVGHWRLKQDCAPSLARLQAQADCLVQAARSPDDAPA